jgi:hypothetical protein
LLRRQSVDVDQSPGSSAPDVIRVGHRASLRFGRREDPCNTIADASTRGGAPDADSGGRRLIARWKSRCPQSYPQAVDNYMCVTSIR